MLVWVLQAKQQERIAELFLFSSAWFMEGHGKWWPSFKEMLSQMTPASYYARHECTRKRHLHKHSQKSCVTHLCKWTREISKNKKIITGNVVQLPRVRKLSFHSSPDTFSFRKSKVLTRYLSKAHKDEEEWNRYFHVMEKVKVC